MFSKFTDRAGKVMELANEEAQRYRHEYIGTEHILLGLVREGSGVAANVMKNLNVDLEKVRQEVGKIVLAGPEPVRQDKLPQTPRAKRVVEYAIEESRNLNHNYVGTEHLLLGLLREDEGVAAQVLMNLGLSLTRVRDEVLALLGHQPTVSSVKTDSSAKDSPPQELLNAPPKIRRAVAALNDLISVLGEMKEDAKEGAILLQEFKWAEVFHPPDNSLRSLTEWLNKLRSLREWFLRCKDPPPPQSPKQDPA